MKKCTYCGIIKDDECFYVSNRGKESERRKSRCKECCNNITREYRSNNRNLVNEKNRASYYRNKEQRRRTQKRYEKKIRDIAGTNGVVYSKILVKAAKQRSKKYGIPFNITYEDIYIPEFCPVLGIKIIKNNGKGHTSNSASIDRIIPELGYVKGNVIVVSFKANSIKTNATPDEILMVGNYYKELAK